MPARTPSGEEGVPGGLLVDNIPNLHRTNEHPFISVLTSRPEAGPCILSEGAWLLEGAPQRSVLLSHMPSPCLLVAPPTFCALHFLPVSHSVSASDWLGKAGSVYIYVLLCSHPLLSPPSLLPPHLLPLQQSLPPTPGTGSRCLRHSLRIFSSTPPPPPATPSLQCSCTLTSSHSLAPCSEARRLG